MTMSNDKRPWGAINSEWEDGDGPPTSRRTVEEVGAPSSRSTVPLALQLVDELRALGIDTVFGIPGGAVSPLYAALLKRPDVRVINAKHETGAVFLAMGYALASGKPGVVLTTAGPGITNAITGIASAFYDSIPILYIAGEVPTTAFGRGALQESSSTGLDAVGADAADHQDGHDDSRAPTPGSPSSARRSPSCRAAARGRRSSRCRSTSARRTAPTTR